MNNAKHTPGPWRIGHGCIKTNIVAGERGVHIALAESRGMPNCEANAALIAAAPDLLAALEAVVEDGFLAGEVFDQVVAAITKAKGE